MSNLAERGALIQKLRALPNQIRELVDGLSETELLAHPEGEWTVAQNVHHLADSHFNAFCRVKLALTENRPTIKPYDQDAWAALGDANHTEVSESLAILKGLHSRWARLLESLTPERWGRKFYHPENKVEVSVEEMLSSYVNHGEGHIRQIKEALATIGK